jgi:hypothetical protein
MPSIGFPLLLIPIAIYNIVVFLMPGAAFTAPLFTLPLLSGVGWAVSFNDVLLALGIILLLFEFARASRPGAKYAMDHILSLLVLGGAGAEFLWLAPFGTSAFFMLVLLACVDFLGGLTLGLRHRRARRAMLRAAGSEAVPAPVAAPAPVAPPAPKPARTEPPPLVTEPSLSASKQPPSSHPQMEVITPEVDSPPQVQPDTAKPGDVGDVMKVEPAHQPASENSMPPPIVPRRD